MDNKKELKKKYKQSLQPMGVYLIKCLVNEKIFVGSSKNLPGKFNSNLFQLKFNSHINKELQEDFNKYGEEKISFTVIDYLEPVDDPNYNYTEDLKVLEQMWLEKLQPYGEKGYNVKAKQRH